MIEIGSSGTRNTAEVKRIRRETDQSEGRQNGSPSCPLERGSGLWPHHRPSGSRLFLLCAASSCLVLTRGSTGRKLPGDLKVLLLEVPPAEQNELMEFSEPAADP